MYNLWTSIKIIIKIFKIKKNNKIFKIKKKILYDKTFSPLKLKLFTPINVHISF